MDIIDTHAHFWDVETIDYPWIEKGSPFDRSFHLADYQRASADVPVKKMIFVECDAHPRFSATEARWVAGLAKVDPRIQGIVARVALLHDTAQATFEAVNAIPLVRGIRDNIQNNPPGFASRADFIAGVRDVHRRGLHFELCLKHHQLAETIDLVKACPDGQFVLDHCAKPDIAAGLREPWHRQIREMAMLPNVVCKISGLLTEADWTTWIADDVMWYMRAAVEAFGAERILFGSDWPVSEVAGGYMAWFNLIEALTANWGVLDRERFFWRNAERVYRLGG